MIYVNDIVHNIDCDVRLFADDTSLFCTVNNEHVTAEKLTTNLERLRLWAWQWKMQFSADKTKEVIFSNKRFKAEHPQKTG